jgi:hypothetical protein
MSTSSSLSPIPSCDWLVNGSPTLRDAFFHPGKAKVFNVHYQKCIFLVTWKNVEILRLESDLMGIWARAL